MIVKGVTPILNVSDVPASLAWFTKLGWRACFSYNDAGPIEDAGPSNQHGPAMFAAVADEGGSCEIFLCCGGQGSRGNLDGDANPTGGPSGSWMSWWVQSPDAVDQAADTARAAGIEVVWPPTDEPWGCRECHIRHPDGHVFRISAALYGFCLQSALDVFAPAH